MKLLLHGTARHRGNVGPGMVIDIPMTIRRFDGGSGTVMVSNGIPLPEGYVTSASAQFVRVLVGGVEKPVYVRALSGRHPDGSLRAILVQFDHNIPDVTPIAASLSINTSRPASTIAARAVRQVPFATALPTDPAYLCSTKWGGLMVPLGAANGIVPFAAQFESDYIAASDAWWAIGTRWDLSAAGWDRGFNEFCFWLRSGDATYFYRACAEVNDYMQNYLILNAFQQPWWTLSQGVALHYWATGDEMSRYQLRKQAQGISAQAHPGSNYVPGNTYGDDRFTAKVVNAALDARMLDISDQPADAADYYSMLPYGTVEFYGQYLTSATLGTWLPLLLSQQRPSGIFGGTQHGGGQIPYMAGMLVTTLMRYYDEVSPDARIVTAVKAWIDDAWANDWDVPTLGFQFNDPRGTHDYLGNPVTPDPLPALNGLIVPPFAWYGWVTGSSAYDAKVDDIMTGLQTPVSRDHWYGLSGSMKAFEQAFSHQGNTFAWRSL